MPNTEEAKSLLAALRAKYPVYNDIHDDAVLQLLGRKYPDAYGSIVEKEFTPSSFKDELGKQLSQVPSQLSKALGGAVNSEAGKQILDFTGKAQEAKTFGEEHTFDPAVYGVRSIASGQSPLAMYKGDSTEKNIPFTPQSYAENIAKVEPPTLGKSAARALRLYGVKDEKLISRVSKNLGPILDNAAVSLLAESPKAIVDLHFNIRKALVQSGVDKSLSKNLATALEGALKKGLETPQTVSAGRPFAPTPSVSVSSSEPPLPLSSERTSLQDVTSPSSKIMDQYKLGTLSLEEAKAQVQGISEQPKVVIKSEQSLSLPERLAKIKDVHQNMLNNKFSKQSVASLDTEELIQAKSLEAQKLEHIANLKEVLRTRAIQLGDEEFWKNTHSKYIANIDNIDSEIGKRANGFLGQEGFAAIPSSHELTTNLLGEAEKASYATGKAIRTIGVPAMVGEFEPSFKPVYWAVQNAYDESHELAMNAHEILDNKFQFTMTPTEQEHLSGLLKLAFDVGKETGNIARYDLPTLQKLGASAREIEAYNRVIDFNDYIASVRVKALKAVRRFEKMSPQDQAKFEKETLSAVKSGGAGHFATERTNGDWVVLKQNEEGKTEFFRLVNSKFKAQELAKSIGGTSFLNKQIDLYTAKSLSTSDLEALIEQAGVDRNAIEIQALQKELDSRTVASYWMKRHFIEGLEFSWKNIIEAQLDYGHRVISNYGRSVGKVAGDEAFSRMAPTMRPEIKEYSKNFIDTFSAGRGKTWAGLSRLIYGSELALDTKNAVQNFLQPITTLYPSMGEYYKGLDIEKNFTRYNLSADKYIADLLTGKASSLDYKTQGIIAAMDKQGTLGKRVFREMMGERGLKNAQMDSFLGSFQTATEFRNRLLAAIAYSDIGQSKLGIRQMPQLLEFVKQKVAYTNFLYDYFNKPPLITGAGKWKPFANTIYMFKHYLNNSISLLAHQTKSGNPDIYTRAWGAYLAQAGLKGLPLAGLAGAVYANQSGHTVEDTLRRVLTKNNVPKPIQDTLLSGIYNLGGVDMSRSLGMGDAIPSKGDLAVNLIGASAGFAQRLAKAATFALRGDWDKASQTAPPKAIRSVIKAYNYLKKGVTDDNGKRLMTITTKDATFVALGFTPSSISQMYSKREAISTIASTHADKQREYNRQAAKALYMEKDLPKFRAIRKQARADDIRLKTHQLLEWRKKFKGRQERPSKDIRRDVRQTEKAFQ